MSALPTANRESAPAFWQADTLYSTALFAAAALVIAALIHKFGVLSGGQSVFTAALLGIFGLYTITMGFPHPGFGHVSFDRVGQVAAILLLGPVDAAWVCAAASLVYPWKRLYQGESMRLVFMASVHNAGLMTFVVLGGGYAYVTLGGAVPLLTLSLAAVLQLLALVATMQVINDLGMMVIFRLRGQDPGKLLTVFTLAVETGSALIAVLVALVVTSYNAGVIVLLLVVLSLGMLVLKRYAEMRSQLEVLVAERTEALRVKTLELERQATQDALTGLYNRRFVDGFLARQMQQVQRGGENFSVAFADLDHFKGINDRYSHSAGDLVLSRVARTLESRCRQTDIVARYGGEEFLLCFPETALRDAERICRELCIAVQETDWASVVVPSDAVVTTPKVTISFGVAQSRDGRSLADLLNDADTQLYRAKQGGRNRVVA